MSRVHTFNVTAQLPKALEPLEELANDLSFSWIPAARSLFRRISPTLWNETNGNPVAVLNRVSSKRLAELARDRSFRAHLAEVASQVRDERAASCWYGEQPATDRPEQDMLVGYFSAEYGISEAMPIYSGGLGVLSGDHLKSTSGLGIPLVAVGLAYQEGYFHQYLNEDGWQQEAPYDNDFALLPMRRAAADDGAPLTVEVTIERRRVRIRVWQLQVGRTRLLLLDTNDPANTHEDRRITAQLYGGGPELRFKQEIVLGIGGLRALRAAGHAPTVFHMNEGHSAFMGLERIREAIGEHGLTFMEALELCAASNVFTTHTPVPAGFDIFGVDQVDRLLPDLHAELGLSRHEFLQLGAHENDPDVTRGFNMAYLALRTSGRVNGVSKLHAQVSRGMWHRLWPGYDTEEVPIIPVTNGVHTRTWVSEEMSSLFERYLSKDWSHDASDPEVWAGVVNIPDSELWRVHERHRERLVTFVRERETQRRERLGRPSHDIVEANELLDPTALTFGFARRFATYKRANLVLRQPERLRALLTDPERPIQLIFAGKAHPKDHPGKELIRQLVHFARDPAVRRRIVFVEEYDIGVARHLVQGVDVWLNTPRRPKEASGTSGMKVVPNGGLNCSVLDGWWAEAYDGRNGWGIGNGELYDDAEQGDAIEADLLLDLLEDQLVPEFYDRGPGGLPRHWIERVKNSMQHLSGVFSTDRMLKDYTRKLYVPASREGATLAGDGFVELRRRAKRREQLAHNWSEVVVSDVAVDVNGEMNLGARVTVEASVRLGTLSPADVVVEIHGGPVDPTEQIHDGEFAAMEQVGASDGAWFRFRGEWTPQTAGRAGVSVRVRPRIERLAPVTGIAPVAWE